MTSQSLERDQMNKHAPNSMLLVEDDHRFMIVQNDKVLLSRNKEIMRDMRQNPALEIDRMFKICREEQEKKKQKIIDFYLNC